MLTKCQHSVYRLRLKKPLPWRVTGARVARHVEEPKGAAEAPYSTSLLPANEPTTRDAFGAPSHPEVLHPEKCREGKYRPKHSTVESARVGEPPPPSRPAGEVPPAETPPARLGRRRWHRVKCAAHANTPASYGLIERLIGVDRSTALARGGAERFEAPERPRRQGTGGAGLRLT